MTSVGRAASEFHCFAIDKKASVTFDFESKGMLDLVCSERLVLSLCLGLVRDQYRLRRMKMIVLSEGQFFLMPVSILFCRGIDMRVALGLVLDEYSNIAYMNYRCDEIARSVPWVHFSRSFRQRGDRVRSFELQLSAPFNDLNFVR